MYTINDVANRVVDGEIVELTVAEKQAIVNEWNNPTPEPSNRERIIRYLRSNPAAKAIVIAIRDDRGLTNQQMLDLLEARYSEEI